MAVLNKMQLLAALVLLMGVAQVRAAMYQCRAINVCDDTVDPKWTERSVEDVFGKFGKIAYNWKPSTTSGCLANKCNTPVTVSFKVTNLADMNKLDRAIGEASTNPTSLSKKALCVESATAALIAADKTCYPWVMPVGLQTTLCRSAQVCSDFVDFAWVDTTATKAITAYLKKNGLATDGITVTKAASVPGCTCNSPATITVTTKVSATANFPAIDAGLAAALSSLSSPLKAACSADATTAYLAAHPTCKKPDTTPTKTKAASTTVCRDVSICDNTVDFAWTKVAAEDAFAPLFKALKVAQDGAHFSVTKVAGTSLKAGSVSCTCNTRALIKITVPASGGAAAVVDDFIAKVSASLDSVQCLASAVAKTCTQPASSNLVTCLSWATADDNADWAWTVNTVKKALAPCFASTKTPTSGLAITRAAGTCASIGGKQCCGANIANIKVTKVPKGQESAFGICARGALTLANLGKPFKCSGPAKC